MPEELIEIRILPEDRRIRVQSRKPLILALADQGFLIRSDCGGKGLCGKCLVAIEGSGHNNLSPPDQSEKDLVGPVLLKAGYRLACRVAVESPLTIRIPQTSSLLYTDRQEAPQLPQNISPTKSKTSQPFSQTGVAVDLGTTTIGLYLCNLAVPQILTSTVVRNPQAIHGADIMSRISAAHSPETRQTLQTMVLNAIESHIVSMCQAQDLNPDQIVEMVIVGNPTMIHLLVNEDPSSLGYYPFEPVFLNARKLEPNQLGFKTLKSVIVQTLPFISGFVGSDIVAAAMASEMAKQSAGTLLVDIGTNGEIFLSDGNVFCAASCATGPAFEGATISSGMEAAEGAIEGVRIDPANHAVSVSVIKHPSRPQVKPAGLCGSGVVAAIAELLRRDILLPDGRFDQKAATPNLKVDTSAGTAFELVAPEDSFTGRGICLTQKDIRAIQLAKGALKAGIDILCRHAKLDHPHQILMAGAFGNHIDPLDAMTIGLFPETANTVPITIGNAAGKGAVWALLDQQYRHTAEQIARETMVVDLVHHPDFEETFLKALAFPGNA